jgi:hypothetical protein
MGKVRLPESVKIRGRVWKIVLCPKKIPFKGGHARGLCSFEDRTIQLYARQSPKLLLSTYWHEVLHALSFEYGFDHELTHKAIFDLEGPLSAFVNDVSHLPKVV